MEKFKNKYRVSSARLQNWDYSWAGAYFITICTEKRRCYFGEISDKQMKLSPVGAVANVLWHEIPYHVPNIELGAFIVMPNHIHGVLIIPNDKIPMELASKNMGKQRFQNIGKNSISSMVGSYKSAVTKHARRLGFEFGWQARFHDHLIRDDGAFQRISSYIKNNPANWAEDTFSK